MDGTRFLDAAGARLEARFIGASARGAPTLVFLHEGLGSVAMWKDWPQTLCDRLGMRGLVYSRPGYGRSTPRPPRHSRRAPPRHRRPSRAAGGRAVHEMPTAVRAPRLPPRGPMPQWPRQSARELNGGETFDASVPPQEIVQQTIGHDRVQPSGSPPRARPLPRKRLHPTIRGPIPAIEPWSGNFRNGLKCARWLPGET